MPLIKNLQALALRHPPTPTLSASGRKVSESDARSVAADVKSSTTELERSSFQLSKRPRLQALVYDILPSIKARLLNTDGLCFNGKRCSECAEGPHSFVLSGARATRSGQHRKSPGPPAVSGPPPPQHRKSLRKSSGRLPQKSSGRFRESLRSGLSGPPAPTLEVSGGSPAPTSEVSGGSTAPTAEVSESTRLNIGSLPRPPRPNIGSLRGGPPPQHRMSPGHPTPTSEVYVGPPRPNIGSLRGAPATTSKVSEGLHKERKRDCRTGSRLTWPGLPPRFSAPQLNVRRAHSSESIRRDYYPVRRRDRHREAAAAREFLLGGRGHLL